MVGTNKALGQHWLKNREILEIIADYAADLDASEVAEDVGVDLCVEIGPGLGFLTSSLLKRFEEVIAVEYDQRLVENLPKSFPGTNLEVVNDDILEVDLQKLIKDKKYVIAGNIPYYITSPILKKVLLTEKAPERAVLLMQKEVVERIIGEKETALSLFVKNRAKVEAGLIVNREEFTPPPKVDSQVLILDPHQPQVSDDVFKLIRVAFRSPRKKLIHNLSSLKSKDDLEKIFNNLNINSNVRPGDLHLTQYAELYDTIVIC